MDPNSPPPPTDMRHGARARLRFLDEQAFWEGRVNRADLMERFGVSVPQATADLGKYQELAPGNLLYDRHAKAYLTTDGFQPVFGTPSAEAWLHRQATGVPGQNFAVEVLPMPRRELNAWLVRRVAGALRRRRSLEILYQTMEAEEPDPTWRWVTPLAIASDGLRWHMRGFNHAAERHEDMVFPRMLEIRGERAAEPVPRDEDWETLVSVHIRPSQDLSPSQQRAVAADFQMQDGIVEVPVRAAMLFNFLRRMRLDRGGRLIELANEADVKKVLRSVSTRYSRTGEFF
ncbi:WYL domain-containing protein [Neoroseomonas oryzicola]|uniref:WYL domain-containing protein n=1 Tax=Neoroseomonas oryzicola TaxID=535904 RepID=A0A9X9WJG3_9PROT|nr:WYL domain-containing protein [Neoroseomonas oryzicola]MBR0660473.1 WYL domain-containing protein [Neoroseomonas oryzicola]NKE18241.1 WYL domain-containing protein [Neoroseomonas oryzicola]